MSVGEVKSRILELLKEKTTMRFDELVDALKEDQSTVMRALLEMEKENYISLKETDRITINITKEGMRVLKHGLPECVLLEILGGMRKHIKDIEMEDKNIAIAWAKNKGLIEIKNGVIYPKRECASKDRWEIEYLSKIGNKEYYSLEGIDEQKLNILKRRKFIEVIPRTVKIITITPEGKEAKLEFSEEFIKEVTPEVIKNELWKSKPFKPYNIYAQSYDMYLGKKHYITQAIEYIRNIWIELGFEEIRGKMLVEAFWNFDTLFVPQNHPAREMQDTFYVDLPLSSNLDKNLLKKVKKFHESGDKESEGWQYEYEENKAKEWVLRTHTTVLSAITLAKLNLEDLPKKYFAIGKVFRNETLDWKHLFEFYQVEGIVVGEGLNFRHLIGYLKQFFKKMGYDNIRIRPAYFPYTELSVEVEVLTPNKGWIELGGAGIFRPEVVKPLLGEDIPVLAWGIGLERIIMNYYGFTDIKYAYSDNLNVLRKSKRLLL